MPRISINLGILGEGDLRSAVRFAFQQQERVIVLDDYFLKIFLSFLKSFF